MECTMECRCASIFMKPRIGKNGDKIKGKPVTDKSVAELAKVSFIITHYAGEVLLCMHTCMHITNPKPQPQP